MKKLTADRKTFGSLAAYIHVREYTYMQKNLFSNIKVPEF